MISILAEFYQVFLPLFVLVLMPAIAAIVCFAIDTYIDFKYYKWNKEHHDKKNSPVEE